MSRPQATMGEAAMGSRGQRAKAALALVPALVMSGCFGAHYIGQQAVGQLHLLRIRRHVDDVIADPSTPRLVRERLQLAMAARQFGIEQLGLRGGGEFTRYVDTGGPVAYNLTAAEKTALKVKRWSFPLVGTVPYLGFFERGDAVKEARRLESSGHDIFLRPVSGYSTLGYFLSPIYAGMLAPNSPGPEGDVRTVEVVLHEMAHSTAYIKSASELNESYATLIGIEGATRFFRQRGSAAESELVRKLSQSEEQQSRAFGSWLEPTLKDAVGFYSAAHEKGLRPEQILADRQQLFTRIQQSYRAAFPTGPRYRSLSEGSLNNAVLLSFGVYHQASDLQQVLLDSVDGDLAALVGLYKQAEGRPDGPEWLRRLAAAHRATLPLKN